MGLEPTIYRLEGGRLSHWATVARSFKSSRTYFIMHGAGFEPAKHNATALKTVPFDHSGIRAIVLSHYGLNYNILLPIIFF